MARPLPFLDECARRYGDAFTLRFAGLGDWVLFSHPEDIKAIFTGDPALLHAGEANSYFTLVLGPNSVLTLDGAAHLRQRRLLLPTLQGEKMLGYGDAMREATLHALGTWPKERPFALHPQTRAIALDVILRTIFGFEEGTDKRRLREALLAYLRIMATPASAFLGAALYLTGRRVRGWAARKITAATDGALLAEIADRRDAPDVASRTDILSLLLQATHEDGAKMTDAELRDELITLLIAGHETASTALDWAFQLILEHEDVRERLEAELDAASAGDDRIDPARLMGLEYLDAVVKETLRLRPIVPIVIRQTKGSVAIRGRTIPPGVRVAACLYLAHRRREVFPDPEVFRPERFLGTKVDPYTWLPFGGGIRRCVGMPFAMLELKTVLATVLSSARLRLAPGPRPTVRRHGLTLAPSNGTRVVFEGPRRPAAKLATSNS
jgi:cytochrome P450